MNSQDFNPDDLLTGINKSILTKGIVIALIVHAIVVIGTSFGLYKDWGTYGVKTPSAIKQVKKQEQVEKAKAEREAAIARKASDAASVASNAVPAKVSAKVKEPAKSEATPPKGSVSASKVKPPEIEPLPPATGEISLDDLGL